MPSAVAALAVIESTAVPPVGPVRGPQEPPEYRVARPGYCVGYCIGESGSWLEASGVGAGGV